MSRTGPNRDPAGSCRDGWRATSPHLSEGRLGRRPDITAPPLSLTEVDDGEDGHAAMEALQRHGSERLDRGDAPDRLGHRAADQDLAVARLGAQPRPRAPSRPRGLPPPPIAA